MATMNKQDDNGAPCYLTKLPAKNSKSLVSGNDLIVYCVTPTALNTMGAKSWAVSKRVKSNIVMNSRRTLAAKERVGNF